MSKRRKGKEVRQYQRVYFCGAEWSYIETVRGEYLLRSLNRNVSDVMASPKYVLRLEYEKVFDLISLGRTGYLVNKGSGDLAPAFRGTKKECLSFCKKYNIKLEVQKKE